MLKLYNIVALRVILHGYVFIRISTSYAGEKNPSGTNYYYGNFRYHFRHEWKPRTLDTSLPLMKEIDMEDCPSIRTSRAKLTGFTGLSILHRLNALYGFDVLRDLVFDVMHNVPLNIASNHLHYYFNEGILSTNDVDRRLKTIQWTPGS